MKLIQELDKNDSSLSKSYIAIDEGETIIRSHFIGGYDNRYGELFIPEGVEVIEKHAFLYCGYHTIYFPKSLKIIKDELFSESFDSRYRRDLTIVYNGSSVDFMELAKVQEENVCESDGFDHYPYYSGNSRWVTYYRCFDNETSYIEVKCLEDNVTLLYGTKNRNNDELPKIKG